MAAKQPCGSVDLGFVEEPDDPLKLLSHFFPSKVGGKPAWLNFMDLPDIDRVRCGCCGKPCVFLLQVYAPNEDKPDCFHRAVFIFICREAGCCKINSSKNLVVFRNQLPRHNSFYSDSPPEEVYDKSGSAHPKCEDFTPLCIVCGCRGGKKCGKCRKVNYCSKEHQVLHWQASHKTLCTPHGVLSAADELGMAVVLFPEYELVMEAEELSIHESQVEDSNAIDVKDYCADAASDLSLCSETSLKDLDAMAASVEDKAFSKFKKLISQEPQQVIRYNRHGQPQWVASKSVPTEDDIPHCACGAKRTFEFQVMPQLLCSLKVDSLSASIDWGTLAIYTCSRDCSTAVYAEEYIWKQDFAEKT